MVVCLSIGNAFYKGKKNTTSHRGSCLSCGQKCLPEWLCGRRRTVQLILSVSVTNWSGVPPIQQFSDNIWSHSFVSVTKSNFGSLLNWWRPFPGTIGKISKIIVLLCRCSLYINVQMIFQVVTSVAMKALHGMFLCRPGATNLPAELNAQIIMVDLYYSILLVFFMKSWLI